jgi:hypothetical protein
MQSAAKPTSGRLIRRFAQGAASERRLDAHSTTTFLILSNENNCLPQM